MAEIDYFDDIRPYRNEEIASAIKRITADKKLHQVIQWLFPDKSVNDILDIILSVSTSDDFQVKLMYPAINSIVAKTSSGLTYDGLENLSPDKNYLFISNHRDITLDSAILQVILFDNGFSTTEISAGSNLFSSPLLLDIGKINKMFTVVREGNVRTFYENLKVLSEYIRHAIVHAKTSIWMAQGNGRTKDGNDQTEIALLKMLHTSYEGDFISGFNELNLVPITISYEYEPCDGLKVFEKYKSLHHKYMKEPGEDLKSIITGIAQPKGNIHLQFGIPVAAELARMDPDIKTPDFFRQLAEMIDQQIQSNYHLFPTNYISHDLISEKSDFSDHYSPAEKTRFREHADKTISGLPGDPDQLERILFQLYANPVENYFSTTNSGI